LELSGPGSKALVAQDMVDQPLSKGWHYINLVGRRLRTYPHNSLSLSIFTTKARTASCLALKTVHGSIMVRPTASPKRGASIAISLEKAAFGPKTQTHVRVSVCRPQFDPKPETYMIRRCESSLTYIKPEVWLLFFHLSTAAGLLPETGNLPNIFLSKVHQKLFMSAAVVPRFGTKNERSSRHAERNMSSLINQNIIPKPRTSLAIESMYGYHHLSSLAVVFIFWIHR
jgi:hypothetical protein